MVVSDKTDAYIIDMSEVQRLENTREVIAEIEFIPLETNTKSLIADVDKIVFHRDRFYVLDKHFHALKVFSEEGKYLFDVGRIGRGPGEFTTLMDFCIDPDEEKLLLLSNNEKALLTYDLDGIYLETTRVNIFASSFSKYENRYYYFINQNENEVSGRYNLIVMNENSNVLERLFPFSQTLNSGLSSASFLVRNRGRLLFHPTLSDTVFQLIDGDAYPKYIFDFGEKTLPESFRSSSENYKTPQKYEYAHLRDHFVDAKEVLSFNYIDKRSPISAYCSKGAVDTAGGVKVLKPVRLGFPLFGKPALGLIGEDTFITYVKAGFADSIRDGTMSEDLLKTVV